MTRRLLKRWREQQLWSPAFAGPSDDILELVAVYSAVQTKPVDQRMATANAMSLMARFEELRIVWSNLYDKEEIWAPLVRFLAAAPAAAFTKFLPPILKAAAAVLAEHLASDKETDGIRVTGDSVQLTAKGFVTVYLRFSQTFSSHTEAISALRSQSPEARRLLASSLAKERSEFISKQPRQVKVTMRLLKWWREQQLRSPAFSTPSGDIRELVAVYSAKHDASGSAHGHRERHVPPGTLR